MGPRCIGQTWRARVPAEDRAVLQAQGCCKALLGHFLATQLRATLLSLCRANLAASCSFKGARLLQAAFVAACPPKVLLITELDTLMPAQD